MDEPEAALSPARQMTLLALLHRFVEAGAQCVIATHSPIIMSYPNSHILQFDAKGINRMRYEDTEHYTITRDFLNRYPAMLDVLLAGDEDDGSRRTS